jgi:hypothetical protein
MMTEAEFTRRLAMTRLDPAVRDALAAFNEAQRNWLREKAGYERFLAGDARLQLAKAVKDAIFDGIEYGAKFANAITAGTGMYALLASLGKDYVRGKGQDAVFAIPAAGIPDQQERYDVFSQAALKAWSQYLDAVRRVDAPLAEFMTPAMRAFSSFSVDPFTDPQAIRMPPLR